MSEDLAKQRFLIISATRFVGLAMVLIGLLSLAGKFGLPSEAGYPLLATGLINMLLIPQLLARSWKSPPQ